MPTFINCGPWTENTPALLRPYFDYLPEVAPGAKIPQVIVVDRELPSGERTWAIKFHLGGSSYLEWLEWPAEVPSPPRVGRGGIRKVNMYGKIVNMPRKMWCYGRAYPFSGQLVPAEPVTPPEVTAVIEATTKLFGLSQPPNMCLTNDYGSGREAIAEHSDDEALAPGGRISEVVCWVDGPACRTLVIRRKVGLSEGETIRDAATRDVVMKIGIGRSVYAMKGCDFQTHFTHEVPELYPALFRRLTSLASDLVDFPTETIARSRWLVDHPEWVGTVLSTKDLERYEEWRAWRVSHTLRRFA